MCPPATGEVPVSVVSASSIVLCTQQICTNASARLPVVIPYFNRIYDAITRYAGWARDGCSPTDSATAFGIHTINEPTSTPALREHQ